MEYNKASCRHKIAYDDGTDQWRDLRKGTKFIWLKDDNGSQNETATNIKIFGSLAVLVVNNLLPSDALLETEYDGKTYQARLDCTSSDLVLIHDRFDRLQYFESLSGWAMSCFRLSNPAAKSVNGWKCVKYKGKSLEEIRSNQNYLSEEKFV